jgi:isoleucyl-tRNA synthetase
VSQALEPMRAAGAIGASLQAEVTLYLDDGLIQRLQAVADELRFLFITSRLDLQPASQRPLDVIRAEGIEAWIVAGASTHGKCVRCWHYREDVGASSEHPDLCGRCIDNVAGVGEVRLCF